MFEKQTATIKQINKIIEVLELKNATEEFNRES